MDNTTDVPPSTSARGKNGGGRGRGSTRGRGRGRGGTKPKNRVSKRPAAPPGARVPPGYKWNWLANKPMVDPASTTSVRDFRRDYGPRDADPNEPFIDETAYAVSNRHVPRTVPLGWDQSHIRKIDKDEITTEKNTREAVEMEGREEDMMQMIKEQLRRSKNVRLGDGKDAEFSRKRSHRAMMGDGKDAEYALRVLPDIEEEESEGDADVEENLDVDKEEDERTIKRNSLSGSEPSAAIDDGQNEPGIKRKILTDSVPSLTTGTTDDSSGKDFEVLLGLMDGEA